VKKREEIATNCGKIKMNKFKLKEKYNKKVIC
jgi:hypothetical protein